MEDKLSKVRAEIERRYNEYMAKDSELAAIRADECLGILSFIDSMQEECNITGIKSRHATGKLKECIDNQTEEGLEQARKQLEENPQECMYARDNYTDEDRKILCDGCEEKCEYAQKEEPVSEDFKQFEETYLDKEKDEILCIYDRHAGLVDGAKWQKEQFEKNRLKHCNSITNEQAELEQGFIDQHLDKYQRMPTYLDAIEYGMQFKEQQLITKAVDGHATFEFYGLDGKTYGTIAHDPICFDDLGLKDTDKVKVSVIKEG